MTAHVLVLCTHNAARSVLGEAMLNHWAARLGRDVRGHSAGSAPSGRVHPQALAALSAAGVATDGLHSKGWDAFAGPEAPTLRAVITVCDEASTMRAPGGASPPARTSAIFPSRIRIQARSTGAPSPV